MRLTDRELWQAANLQDFRFRLGFTENSRERNAQEHFDVLYKGASFEAKITAVLTMPDLLRTWGTDHSRWDGNVDFKPMHAMGARFTFIKAMEGTVPTTYYVENTVRAKAEGLAVAPYHWLHANGRVNCKTQAQKFWERVWSHVGKLPPLLDFEWTYWAGAAAYPNYNDLDIWVTEFTRISGIKPLWYSAAGYMNLFGRMSAALRAKFAGFVVANYKTLIPWMPLGFTQDDWEFWQFAADGNADVISPNDAGKKEVDLIYSKRTHADFDTRYGTGDPVPEPEPTEDPMPILFGEVIVTELNIRPTAGTAQASIGKLKHFDLIEASEEVNGWWKLTSIKRGSVQVPLPASVCYAYEGLTNGYIRDLSPTPDPTPAPTLPAYFTAHDAAGNDLAIYDKRQ